MSITWTDADGLEDLSADEVRQSAIDALLAVPLTAADTDVHLSALPTTPARTHQLEDDDQDTDR